MADVTSAHSIEQCRTEQTSHAVVFHRRQTIVGMRPAIDHVCAVDDLSGSHSLVTDLVGGGHFSFAGYFLPNGILDRMVAKRQHELFMAFPDALDLLRVCVEAGLGLDAAIKRVGQEIQLESHALAQEFSLLGLELRAGASRNNALRNLALRIGLEDINSLVSMLIQADRFGTSMADSLRVHSESLRSKRRIKAEEAAAKLPVKILLPLIFCVFPSLLTVLMGPAVINILQLLMPRMANA